MPSTFPLEIEETILDFLAEDDKGHSALKTCSLVCQAFLHICRKHIFGNIVLGPFTTHAFERLLRETPEIADYIRNLDYSIRIADLTNPSIQKTLKRISRLEFLTCRNYNYNGPKFYWSDNLIHPTLLHLLHLPTLTHFRIDNIFHFVVSDLIPCVNLKYLSVGVNTGVNTIMAAENTYPAAFSEHSIQLDELVAGNPATAMKLCTARRPDGQPIIDFGSLSKIKVDLEELDGCIASQELFRRCHSLTDAHISFLGLWHPRNVKPSLADMLQPSMQTLKHIVVNIDVDIDDDPLFGILSEFEVIGTKNIIETVTIGIVVVTDANCWRGDEWGRLDEVLTTPGWVSLKGFTGYNFDRLLWEARLRGNGIAKIA